MAGDAVMEGGLNIGARAGRICSEGGDRTAVGTRIAMIGGQIEVSQGMEEIRFGAGGDFFPPAKSGGNAPPARLGSKVLLGTELTVETSMRQPGIAHDVRNAHPVKASIAE